MRLTTMPGGDFPKPDYVSISDWLRATAFDVEFVPLAEADGIHIQIDQADNCCFAAAFQDRAGDLWRGRA